ncbi:MAG TPA: TetR/AcrR family transcriptional regulator [Anaerolineae bacterium]|nr:TetR/AcrR family transcriptional regulator [Anaerolineae bacterium]
MDKTPHLSENAPPDRRTQRTRQTLSDALIDLIQEKRYEAITVQDICDRANVGRSTFYAHYQDKDDLLASNFQQVMQSLGSQVEWRDGQFVFPVTPLFKHVQEHHHLYKALAWGGGFDVLLRAGQQQWRAQIEQHLVTLLPSGHSPSIPADVATAYLAGALQTLLLWWLDRKMPYPPERMDEMFQQLVMPGVNAALRV